MFERLELTPTLKVGGGWGAMERCNVCEARSVVPYGRLNHAEPQRGFLGRWVGYFEYTMFCSLFDLSPLLGPGDGRGYAAFLISLHSRELEVAQVM